jgi:Radical SAM superfamily/4Fe-4S single cluster domain
MKSASLSMDSLYRLPWTLPDNGITWLEPTAQCNLSCYGCYRKNVKNAHKPLEEVKHELDFFQSVRKTDCISIAGGDPLLYPHIVELVADIKRRGLKPIINTNGIALTKELLHELKLAGVFGFTLHIDSKQGRGRDARWLGKNEVELNELRLYFAEMLAAEGGVACSFNSTVYRDTLQYVPDLLDWAHKHIDIVHTMVFILFRSVAPDFSYNFFAGERPIAMDELHYHADETDGENIMAPEILGKIREKYPEFAPAAYLNGTQKPDHCKWLLSERLGTKDAVLGYPGKKFLELIMTTYHYKHDRYISYASPKALSLGRAALLGTWGFDKGIRAALKNYLRYVAANPARLFRKVYLQSVMIIQPVDMMPNGDQSMCDGCPDVTYWKDDQGREQLVWSCRLEELTRYGTFLRMVPKNGKESSTPGRLMTETRAPVGP